MKIESVKAIFTNLLFVIGVVLTIFGFVKGSLTLSKLVLFDRYPLPQYEETRCMYAIPIPEKAVQREDFPSNQNEKCLADLEYHRKIRKTEDVVISLSTLFSGFILILSFKRFIFK